MFCLFNKVYLDLDFNLNKSQGPYILVSPLAGSGFLPENRGNQLLAHNSYGKFLKRYFPDDSAKLSSILKEGQDNTFVFDAREAFAEGQEEEQALSGADIVPYERRFWDFLLSYPKERSLVLYVEPKVFDDLLIKYFGAAYPKAPADLLYRVYELTHMKYDIYFSQLNREDSSLEKELRKIRLLDKKNFQENLESSHGFRELKGRELLNLPFEFLLAGYLAGSKGEIRKTIAQEARSFCNRFVFGEIAGLKRDLLRNYIVLGKVFDKLKDWDPLQKGSLEEAARLEPRLAFLADYDFDANHLDKIRQYGEDIFWAYQSYLAFAKESSDFIHKIVKTVLTQPEYDPVELVEYDIQAGGSSFVFGSGSLEKLINPHLVTYLYEMRRRGDSALKHFDLEGRSGGH